MVSTLIRVSCDWCNNYEECIKNLLDFDGKVNRVGEKTLRKNAVKKGWISIYNGDGSVNDFCCKECYDLFKEEE